MEGGIKQAVVRFDIAVATSAHCNSRDLAAVVLLVGGDEDEEEDDNDAYYDKASRLNKATNQDSI